jgi:glycosyltransferase involved in cell wall biosynthesis
MSSGAESTRIAVIIPVRNKIRFLERSIGSVMDAVAGDSAIDVVLVENGSSDGSAEMLARLFGNRAMILRSTSRTAGAARNHGARSATPSIFCFLDADVTVPIGFFQRIRRVFEVPHLAAAGCTVALANDGWISRVWERLHDRGISGISGLINSADFSVRRDVFWQVGGFDEALITGEDADICLRLAEAGHLLVEVPALKVVHHDNPRTLAEFARKESWRGLGASATFRFTRIDRPLAMTVAHGVLLLVGLGSLILTGLRPVGWGLLLLSAIAVPLMTVHYRRVLAHRPPGVGPALVLYQTYFLARLLSLFLIMSGRHRKE